MQTQTDVRSSDRRHLKAIVRATLQFLSHYPRKALWNEEHRAVEVVVEYVWSNICMVIVDVVRAIHLQRLWIPHGTRPIQGHEATTELIEALIFECPRVWAAWLRLAEREPGSYFTVHTVCTAIRNRVNQCMGERDMDGACEMW